MRNGQYQAIKIILAELIHWKYLFLWISWSLLEHIWEERKVLWTNFIFIHSTNNQAKKTLNHLKKTQGNFLS